MDEEVIWYNLDVVTAEQLRSVLTQRKDKAIRAVEDLSVSSLDFINNFTNYITVDDVTHCKALFENKLPYIMGSIIGKGKVGQIALLTYKDISLIIKSIPTSAPRYLSIRILDHPGLRLGTPEGVLRDSINSSKDYWKIYNVDGVRKIIAVGGDNFSNQTCMHLILNIILGNSLYYIRQYDAFYCGGLGYNVIEYCNSGDLHGFLEDNPINDDLIFGALSHIIAPLSVLKHPMYNFNHSDLKVKNVFVHKTNEGFIFKIADYDKSSITWKGLRFYNWSENYGTAVPIKIEKDPKGSDVYVLQSMISLQLYTMHNPYGVPMSYDIYTLIISLLGVNNVWKKYINGELPRLKALMHRLFTGELYYVIMGKIAQDHGAVSSISHINTLINGMYLQYDVSYVYSMVGVNPPPLYIKESEELRVTVSKDSHICLDSCQTNPERSPTYKTCTTNNYSKTGFTGSSTMYNWDYCPT